MDASIVSVSDEAAAWLAAQPEPCVYDTTGCCGDPADHDYCGGCPLATVQHPDRNGGYPAGPPWP